MKTLAAMKKIFLLIILIKANLANAQIPPNLSEMEKMDMAIRFAMTDLCKIDRDSRQCELLQILYGKQNSIATGKYTEIEDHASPETIENLLNVSKSRKLQLEKMEFDKKLKLSRTYKALDLAKDSICGLNKKTKPCASALSFFIFQTEIEIGKELNPSPTVAIETKNQVRKFILKEHPSLNESSEILMEAILMHNLREGSTISKENSDDKKSDACSNKYDHLYNSKKCK
jgi:hypothetical protein